MIKHLVYLWKNIAKYNFWINHQNSKTKISKVFKWITRIIQCLRNWEGRGPCDPSMTFSDINKPFFLLDKCRWWMVWLEEISPLFDFSTGNSIDFEVTKLFQAFWGAVMVKNWKARGASFQTPLIPLRHYAIFASWKC